MSGPSPQDDLTLRWLAAAANAVRSVRYGWLATPGDRVNVRPMGRTPPAPEDDPWLLRFVTDDRSRKAGEIRRSRHVSVAFQREADDAYVALFGEAEVKPGAAGSALWRAAYEAYFPTAGDRGHAAFVEILVTRIELWIRGVTSEPFGLRPAILERDPSGPWRRT